MFIWTIGDAVTVIVLALMILCAIAISLSIWIRQAMCKHDGIVGETRACEAICRQCGKNLGFIGTWREKRNHGDKSE